MTDDNSQANAIKSTAEATNEKKQKAAKAPKNKKTKRILIYSACVVASALSIGVVIWAVMTFMGQPELDEDFFISDDTKTTVSLTPTGSDPDSTLRQTHVVYEYDGDLVVGMKTYFEYPDAESAAADYEVKKNQPEFKNSELKDNFIIVTADPKQFEGLTASDIRQQAAAIEAYQAQQRQEQLEKEAKENPEAQENPEGQEEPVAEPEGQE